MGKKPGGHGKASTLVTFSAAYAHCFSTKPTFIYGPTNLARNFSRLETSPHSAPGSVF